ncbi:vWA domain-containing protein [Sulfuriflexus sp.]|uniref:vWA domain-containing protein n=1 Tax=Sulfuriflexus sp. TaxID=2015443 RepID=UPI0028CF2990|nr:VWA domain-containing protein [Sulfuriflexus sp.]MDT8405188.1 VWA domain-containing protein [Sulfuriflexus sp.]
MFAHISLQQPWWLWLLPALFLLRRAICRYAGNVEHHGIEQSPSTENRHVHHPLPTLLASLATRSSHQSGLYNFAFWLVIAALCLALSGPERSGEKRPDPPRERDIIFIVDTSVSMTLRDYQVEGKRIARMRVIRAMLDSFITELKGDRVGIIAFADTAHVLSPLTNDASLLHNLLPKLRTGIAGRTNAIGDAIALAVKQARQTKARRQVLILVSDAALPTGTIPATRAAALAAEEGLPLYTIAVGAGSYTAEEARITGLIYHPANLPLMQKLAGQTGAKTYQAGDHASLQAAVRDIEQLEKNTVQAAPQFYREPLFRWPLLAAILLLTIMQALNLASGRYRRGKR